MYSKPTIYNLTLTSANTEYSQALSAKTKKVLIRERSGGSDIKLAYTSGESGTNYITIPASTSKWLDSVYLRGRTLYMQCADAGKVVEIEEWADQT